MPNGIPERGKDKRGRGRREGGRGQGRGGFASGSRPCPAVLLLKTGEDREGPDRQAQAGPSEASGTSPPSWGLGGP